MADEVTTAAPADEPDEGTGGAPDSPDLWDAAGDDGQDAAQQELFELNDLQEEAASLDTTDGEYSGVRLQAQHPRLYKAVVRLLAVPLGVQAIARLLGVSSNTVMAVRDREGPAIETEKRYLARQAFGVAGLAIEAAIEKLLDPKQAKKEGLRDLLVSWGIAIDKGQLLTGEATSRVEIKQTEPGHQDYIETLRRVTDIQAEETDLGGETRGQKGAARALPEHEDEDSRPPAEPLADCPERGAGRRDDGQDSRQGEGTDDD